MHADVGREKVLKKRGRLGMRIRVILILFAAGGGVAVTLALIFKGLFFPIINKTDQEITFSIARIAKVSAPEDPREWHTWANKLDGDLEDVEVFIIHSMPGSDAFRMETKARGISNETGIKAFETGELIEMEQDSNIVTIYERLSSKWGGSALLVMRFDKKDKALLSKSIWILWSLFVLMSVGITLTIGYVFAWFLLVNPAQKSAQTLRKALSLSNGDLDIVSIRDAVEVLAKKYNQMVQRAERLACELNRIRQDLKGAQATLIKTEKLASVGQLAAGIAHEIGNPIGIILGLSEILKSGQNSEKEVIEYASKIHSATIRVHGIIKDLLTYARPKHDEGACSDVKAVIDATLNLLKPHKKFKDVEVIKEYSDQELFAEIQPSQLEQILINLMLNSADATQGKGRITIKVWSEDRWVLISVADNGCGIPQENLSKIFDPFFTTKPQGEGGGLGLWICAQLVEINGGDISVESEVGQGTCFRIRLWREMVRDGEKVEGIDVKDE